jgi:hypothetical protein
MIEYRRMLANTIISRFESKSNSSENGSVQTRTPFDKRFDRLTIQLRTGFDTLCHFENVTFVIASRRRRRSNLIMLREEIASVVARHAAPSLRSGLRLAASAPSQ